MNLDPRIGMLNGGKFYAMVNGYGKPPVTGTLEEVEIALGIRKAASKFVEYKQYIVTLSFQYPAWDETRGYQYLVTGTSKSDAIKTARRLAENDGHAATAKGRYWFSATEE